jgi:outer membrane biogenesis lipoprotein LolB
MTFTGKRCPLKASAALANRIANRRSAAPWTALAVPTFLLLACTRTAPPQSLSITYKPVMPYCYVSDIPEPPPAIDFDFKDDDVIRRTTVHIGQYNLLQQWAVDMQTWSTSVRECLVEAMQGGQ